VGAELFHTDRQTDGETDKHTISKCNIYCSSTATMVARTRLIVNTD
jgi:hypothetical protein